MKTISAATAAAVTLAAMVAAAPAASAETQANTAPQAAPAPPANLHVVKQTADEVQLAWNAPSGATGKPTYFVGGTPCSPQPAGSATNVTLSSANVDPNCGLSPGKTYQISVKMKDDANNQSSYSNTVSVTLAG